MIATVAPLGGLRRLPRVPLSLRLHRYAYRCAYLGLRLWWFLARPHVTGVKCVLTDGDHVLLVRHTYGSRGWDLPGGTVKRGEPPAEAARREIAEELGVDPPRFVSLGSFSGWIENHHDTVHCFQAEVSAPQLTLARAEIAKTGWFPRDQLPADRGRYVSRMIELTTPTR